MKIVKERTFPYPCDIVWTALTDARAIRQWWVDTDFQPVVGQTFFFQDAPQGKWDGRLTGEVLEADPPRRVRFTWNGGGHDTMVTYELQPNEAGDATRLILTHEGFQGIRGLFLSTMLRFGWGKLVRKLLPQMLQHIAARGIDVPFPHSSKREQVNATAA